MSDSPSTRLNLARSAQRRPLRFDWTPDAGATARIVAALDLQGLRKMRLTGEVVPRGRTDWRLDARLGATAIQSCVVTLEPVTSRVDTDVARTYLAEWREPEGAEVEMLQDETLEPLPASLDLEELATEALALALPDYPRADGAEPVALSVTEPGAAPLTDEDVRPFAGLKGLRARLAGDEDA